MAARPTKHAQEQAERHVREWLADHPEEVIVPRDSPALWISDFDGNMAQMRSLTVAEFKKHGWRLCTSQGRKVLARVGRTPPFVP